MKLNAASTVVLSLVVLAAFAPTQRDASRNPEPVRILPRQQSGDLAGPFAEDVEMRQALGLRVDIAYIKDLHAEIDQPGGGPDGVSDDLLAIPLTAAETTREESSHELSQRDGEIIKSYMKPRPEMFAGLIVMHDERDYLQVGVTSDAAAVMSDLRALVPHPDLIKVIEYPYSYERIDALATAVVSDHERLASLGVQVVGGGFDSETGLARIDVSSDASNAAVILGALYPDDGQMLAVQRIPGFSPGGNDGYQGPPSRGGSKVTGIFGCTSGFNLWGSGSGEVNYFATTAGHCQDFGYHLYQRAWDLGTVAKSVQNVKADVLKVHIGPDSVTNTIILDPGNRRQITHQQGRALDNTGDPVCVSTTVYANDYNCGTIANTSYDWVNGKGVTMPYMRLADSMYSRRGDSGGPVFYGGEAMGGLVAVCDYENSPSCDQSLYSHIYDITDEMNALVKVS